MTKVNYKSLILILGLIVISFLFVWYIFAWTEPTVVPPGGNVPAPLNVGPDGQTKEGGLWLAHNSAVTTGLIVEYGNVGIGTITPDPDSRLTIFGNGPTIHLEQSQVATESWNLTVAGNWATAAGTFLIGRESDASSTQSPLAISSGGNVGIGTTSPAFKLDVYSSVANNARIGRAEIGGWPANSAYAYFGNQNLNHAAAGNYAILQSTGGTTYVNAASGAVVNFRINNADKMQLQSDGRLRLFGSNAGMWIEAGTNDWFVGRTGADLRFYQNGDRFRINSGGDATLYGDSPQLKFQDSDNDDYWIHANSGKFYILPDRTSNGSWEGPYVIEARADTNSLLIYGSEACRKNGTGCPVCVP